MGASAIGGIVGAVGAMQKGAGEAQMYNYQAGVAQMNQRIAQQNADYARQAGEVEAQQKAMQVRAQVGDIKARQAASGLDISSGSPLAVRTSAEEVGAENVALVRSDAAKKAYGYEVQGLSYGAESTLDQYAASRAKTAGMFEAAGSILGGAGNVSSKWFQYKSDFS
jgi:hypothetical protein